MVSPRSLGQPQNVSNFALSNTILSGTTLEQTVFVAPSDCRIKRAYVTVDSGVTASASPYLRIELINKGVDGAGSSTLASIQTNAGSSGVSLVAYKAHDMTSGTANETLANTNISGTAALDLKITNHSGVNGTAASIALVWEKSAGLKLTDL